MIKGLSLFANVGIAELLLKKAKAEVILANEIDEKRANFYSHTHKNSKMIIGDITDSVIFSEIVNQAKKEKVDFIMATPPCQGMSLNGTKDPSDPRNQLITYAIDMVLELKPKYVFLENVPQQLKTQITYNGHKILVPDYIEQKISEYYNINQKIIDTSEYGVPQKRKRSIVLCSLKGQKEWVFPSIEKKVITVRDAIGHLPVIHPVDNLLDKDLYDKTITTDIHPLHIVPKHSAKHIKWMSHTPEGKSAFQNEKHFPKKDGRRISGGAFSYRRINWDKPAPTVTQNNGVISSFSNVHPGREIKNGLFSDPRVLTVYEIMKITSIPDNWSVPEWANESFIRKVIGEGIPPLAVYKIFKELTNE